MIYREIKEDCFAYDLENDTCKCLKMLVLQEIKNGNRNEVD